jgi:hypothetical protein
MRPGAALSYLALVAACVTACDEREDDAPTVAELVAPADDAPGQDTESDDDDDDDDEHFNARSRCYTVAARVPCGGNRLARELGCPSVHVYPCDLDAYFDCVEDQVTCTDDALDTSRLPTCLELLSCE